MPSWNNYEYLQHIQALDFTPDFAGVVIALGKVSFRGRDQTGARDDDGRKVANETGDPPIHVVIGEKLTRNLKIPGVLNEKQRPLTSTYQVMDSGESDGVRLRLSKLLCSNS